MYESYRKTETVVDKYSSVTWQEKEKATTMCMTNINLHNAADIIGEHTDAASAVTAI